MPDEILAPVEDEIIVLDEEAPQEGGDGTNPPPPAGVEAAGADDEDGDEVAALEKETGNPLFGPWKERLSKTQRRRDEYKKNLLAEQAKRKEIEDLRAADAEESRRLNEQALLYAHQMREQAEAALKQKAELEKAYRENGIQANASTLGSLQEQYRQALENSDHDKAAKIAAAMSQVSVRQQQFEAWRPSSTDIQLPEPPQIEQRRPATQMAVKWGEANQWFFPESPEYNPDKAAYARVIDQHVTEKGYNPNSAEYYHAIDFYLKQRFPEAPTAAPSPSQAATPRTVTSPVAPPSSAAPSRSGVRQTAVTQDDRVIAAQLGIDPKEIAKMRLQMEIAAGRM